MQASRRISATPKIDYEEETTPKVEPIVGFEPTT